jgi:UDP-N-acetylglucosamine 2-epimerase (non-hydrolysing)
MNIIHVAGARPNFMKIAPIIKACKKEKDIKNILVHTGQHYDKNMSETFFHDLDLPEPDYNLNVGSGSHAVQTAHIMIAFEEVCLKEKPDLVIVVGDVNSTIACALVAKKLHIQVAHVEAGLRSGDMHMPEEINRILTDHISDYLFVTEEAGTTNLKQEGIAEGKTFLVGNVMIDALKNSADKIQQNKKREELGLQKKNYCVLTLHRPATVDDKETLSKVLHIIENVQQDTTIVWPLHPRTKKNIESFGLEQKIKKKNIIITEALSYLPFMNLVTDTAFILTDSGGIQQETTALGIPCITLRNTTELPITVSQGTNTLCGLDEKTIQQTIKEIKTGKYKKSKVPALWDGKAAERIVKLLIQRN